MKAFSPNSSPRIGSAAPRSAAAPVRARPRNLTRCVFASARVPDVAASATPSPPSYARPGSEASRNLKEWFQTSDMDSVHKEVQGEETTSMNE